MIITTAKGIRVDISKMNSALKLPLFHEIIIKGILSQESYRQNILDKQIQMTPEEYVERYPGLSKEKLIEICRNSKQWSYEEWESFHRVSEYFKVEEV